MNRHDQWLLTAPIYVFLPILVAQFVLDPSLVLVGLLGGMAFATPCTWLIHGSPVRPTNRDPVPQQWV